MFKRTSNTLDQEDQGTKIEKFHEAESFEDLGSAEITDYMQIDVNVNIPLPTNDEIHQDLGVLKHEVRR